MGISHSIGIADPSTFQFIDKVVPSVSVMSELARCPAFKQFVTEGTLVDDRF